MKEGKSAFNRKIIQKWQLIPLEAPIVHMSSYLTGGLGLLYQQLKESRSVTLPLYDYGEFSDEDGHFRLHRECIMASRYRVVKVISTMGHSSVLVQAEDLFFKKKIVMIKILHTGLYKIGMQETHCMWRLACSDPDGVSNTLKLLNTFTFDGHYCMVLEPLHPEPLTNIFHCLPREKILPSIRKVALRLLSTLGFLYQENVIHADLKPENLLLEKINDLGSIKVIDFGNALHHVHKEVSLYYEDFELQTLLYRAPEVMFGIPFGTEIDMWSFGCILAELYLGKPLFPGTNKLEILEEMTKLLGPFPSKIFQRGKFYYDLRKYTDNCIQQQDSGDMLKCFKDYDFRDFLAGILRYDPDERLTPSLAARHPFLAQEFPVGFLLPTTSLSGTCKAYPMVKISASKYKFTPRISTDIKRSQPSSCDLLRIGTSSPENDDIGAKNGILCPRSHDLSKIAKVNPVKRGSSPSWVHENNEVDDNRVFSPLLNLQQTSDSYSIRENSISQNLYHMSTDNAWNETTQLPNPQLSELPNPQRSELPNLQPIELPNLQPIELPNPQRSELPYLQPIELPNPQRSELPNLRPIELPYLQRFELPNLHPSEVINLQQVGTMNHHQPSETAFDSNSSRINDFGSFCETNRQAERCIDAAFNDFGSRSQNTMTSAIRTGSDVSRDASNSQNRRNFEVDNEKDVISSDILTDRSKKRKIDQLPRRVYVGENCNVERNYQQSNLSNLFRGDERGTSDCVDEKDSKAKKLTERNDKLMNYHKSVKRSSYPFSHSDIPDSQNCNSLRETTLASTSFDIGVRSNLISHEKIKREQSETTNIEQKLSGSSSDLKSIMAAIMKEQEIVEEDLLRKEQDDQLKCISPQVMKKQGGTVYNDADNKTRINTFSCVQLEPILAGGPDFKIELRKHSVGRGSSCSNSRDSSKNSSKNSSSRSCSKLNGDVGFTNIGDTKNYKVKRNKKSSSISSDMKEKKSLNFEKKSTVSVFENIHKEKNGQRKTNQICSVIKSEVKRAKGSNDFNIASKDNSKAKESPHLSGRKVTKESLTISEDVLQTYTLNAEIYTGKKLPVESDIKIEHSNHVNNEIDEGFGHKIELVSSEYRHKAGCSKSQIETDYGQNNITEAKLKKINECEKVQKHKILKGNNQKINLKLSDNVTSGRKESIACTNSKSVKKRCNNNMITGHSDAVRRSLPSSSKRQVKRDKLSSKGKSFCNARKRLPFTGSNTATKEKSYLHVLKRKKNTKKKSTSNPKNKKGILETLKKSAFIQDQTESSDPYIFKVTPMKLNYNYLPSCEVKKTPLNLKNKSVEKLSDKYEEKQPENKERGISVTHGTKKSKNTAEKQDGFLKCLHRSSRKRKCSVMRINDLSGNKSNIESISKKKCDRNDNDNYSELVSKSKIIRNTILPRKSKWLSVKNEKGDVKLRQDKNSSLDCILLNTTYSVHSDLRETGDFVNTDKVNMIPSKMRSHSPQSSNSNHSKCKERSLSPGSDTSYDYVELCGSPATVACGMSETNRQTEEDEDEIILL